MQKKNSQIAVERISTSQCGCCIFIVPGQMPKSSIIYDNPRDNQFLYQVFI